MHDNQGVLVVTARGNGPLLLSNHQVDIAYEEKLSKTDIDTGSINVDTVDEGGRADVTSKVDCSRRQEGKVLPKIESM